MKNENSKTEYVGGVGFFGLLTIVFITLRLIGVIDWGWWLVLAPLWMPIALILAIIVIIIIVMLIVVGCSELFERLRWRKVTIRRYSRR